MASQNMRKTYTVTALTSISVVDPGSIFVHARVASNSADDFVEFLLLAANAGFIKRGYCGMR